MIKHISISGGGPLFLNMYGAIKRAEETKIWEKSNIETLHGTSAGAILCVMIALDYAWDILDNYIINRPWQNVLSFNVLQMYEYYEKNGILDMTLIEEMFMPLFKGIGLQKNITLGEFESIIGKKLYIYATNFNTFEVEELSADVCPSVSVLDAVYASCTLPILFRPQKIQNVVYIDGCIFLDNPLAKTMEKGYAATTVLAISKKQREWSHTDATTMNIFDYLAYLMNTLFTKTQLICTNKEGIVEIMISSSISELSNFFSIASNPVERRDAINRGIADANDYIEGIANLGTQ